MLQEQEDDQRICGSSKPFISFSLDRKCSDERESNT